MVQRCLDWRGRASAGDIIGKMPQAHHRRRCSDWDMGASGTNRDSDKPQPHDVVGNRGTFRVRIGMFLLYLLGSFAHQGQSKTSNYFKGQWLKTF